MKYALIALLALGIASSSFAQAHPGQKAGKDSTATMAMTPKAHVCTGACKNGKHTYAHGEKGHVCTDKCKMGMADSTHR